MDLSKPIVTPASEPAGAPLLQIPEQQELVDDILGAAVGTVSAVDGKRSINLDFKLLTTVTQSSGCRHIVQALAAWLGGKEPNAAGLPHGFTEELSLLLAEAAAQHLDYSDYEFNRLCLESVALGPRKDLSKITKMVQLQIWMGVTMKLRKEEGKAVPPSLAWMKLDMKYNGDDVALLKLAREDRTGVLVSGLQV
jgi:hypothetical protein